MITYEPWSINTLEQSMKKYKDGEFSIFDIELSGNCNYNCIYCDSPDRTAKCNIPFEKVAEVLETKRIVWIHICGLGEPTVENNYEYLLNILNICERNNVKCSIFSNLSNLTEDLQEYIKQGVLYLIFKYDSIDTKVLSGIYGSASVDDQLKNINKIKKLVRMKKNSTNLAASIVPTQLNKSEIVSIVKYCNRIGISPFIGELENSGKGQIHYENLKLSNEELKELKMSIEDKLGFKYVVPVCPSVISGIHINCNSKIVVDKFSGLSCHWFWLEEPSSEVIADFCGISNLDETMKNIILYRNQKLDQVVQMADCIRDTVFGGCGGDIKALLSKYLSIHKELL